MNYRIPQRVILQEEESEKSQQIEEQNSVEIEQVHIDRAQELLKKIVGKKHAQFAAYYANPNEEEDGFELGFSQVGNFQIAPSSSEANAREVMKYLQPGFIFEVIVTDKVQLYSQLIIQIKETRELIVVLQRFLSFCDKCYSQKNQISAYSTGFKHHEADFGLFSKHRNSLDLLMKVNTMNIKGVIDDSEVIEDFSCFNYYINFNKIQVGDHLNAVVLQIDHDTKLNKPILQMSLKNKSLLGGKLWSLVNLQDPRTFNIASPISFRLGFTHMIGKSQEYNVKSDDEKQKLGEEMKRILAFKEKFGVLSLHYQIQNDVFFLNKQNYELMIKSLRLSQFHSVCSVNNLDVIQTINLDYRRRIDQIELAKLSAGTIQVQPQPVMLQRAQLSQQKK